VLNSVAIDLNGRLMLVCLLVSLKAAPLAMLILQISYRRLFSVVLRRRAGYSLPFFSDPNIINVIPKAALSK
jgi:hypothetical protein